MDVRLQRLLEWYRRNGRDLPWRKTRDPYRIFVSELMLQQTQVDRVRPKYADFLRKFPTWNSLARAKTADVIRAWSGLGYNRRALYAREAAARVVADGVPATEEGWRRLKGVGPYMAAALAAFVNHARAVVIDTNVRRVAARAFLGFPHPSPADDARLARVLRDALPKTGRHWEIPQAFMDLGSAICLPRSPKCGVCPLRNACNAAPKFLSGIAARRVRRKNAERVHRDKPDPDRIYRGRILRFVATRGRVRLDAVGPAVDPAYDAIADRDWIRAMTDRLIKDGLLVRRRGDILTLPRS